MFVVLCMWVYVYVCVNKMNASTETAEMRVSVYLSTRFWTPEASLQCGSMKAVLTKRNYMRTVYSTSSNIQNTPMISGVSIFFYSKKATNPFTQQKVTSKDKFFLLILFHRDTHGGNVPWIFKWFIHHFWMKQNAKTGMESRRSRRWHISLLKWRVEWNIVV